MPVRERTFLMVKPDGVKRQLVGNVITRLEEKGLKLVALKMMKIAPEMAEQHYGEHKGKSFFAGLIEFITSGPVVAMVWEGDNVVEMVRTMIGATDPLKAAPGTIRGDLAVFTGKNLVHGSDSNESAACEINLFFPEGGIFEYGLPVESSLYDE